jgi:hypothetical protein
MQTELDDGVMGVLPFPVQWTPQVLTDPYRRDSTRSDSGLIQSSATLNCSQA